MANHMISLITSSTTDPFSKWLLFITKWAIFNYVITKWAIFNYAITKWAIFNYVITKWAIFNYVITKWAIFNYVITKHYFYLFHGENKIHFIFEEIMMISTLY